MLNTNHPSLGFYFLCDGKHINAEVYQRPQICLECFHIISFANANLVLVVSTPLKVISLHDFERMLSYLAKLL